MDNKGETEIRSGIGFFGVLGVAFIVLKLCHVIDWPWLWVLAPIWGVPVLWVVTLIALFIFWKVRGD